jgi:hypothetical protein
MAIDFILNILVTLGIIPKSIIPLIPILIKDAPAAEELITTIVKIINDMEAKNVPTSVAVKAVAKHVQTIGPDEYPVNTL